MAAGVIRPSRSPWASPLHLGPKSKPGEWRVTGDYRVLNAVTKLDHYPLPHSQSLSNKLHRMTLYSKIGVLRAYHQIPMNQDGIEKTAVTPFGLYDYVYMPMGLKNAGSTFQRVMDCMFRDVDCVFVYLDDLLISSPSEQQHLKDLELVFRKLQDHNLKISLDECLQCRKYKVPWTPCDTRRTTTTTGEDRRDRQHPPVKGFCSLTSLPRYGRIL